MEYKTAVYETPKYIVRIHEPIRTEAEQQRRKAEFIDSCRAYCRAIEREKPGYFDRREVRAG